MRSPPWCVRDTTNGLADRSTYRTMPAAMRFKVFSASGFFRSKIDFAGSDQSMHSAAVRHGEQKSEPARVCVGAGHVIG